MKARFVKSATFLMFLAVVCEKSFAVPISYACKDQNNREMNLCIYDPMTLGDWGFATGYSNNCKGQSAYKTEAEAIAATLNYFNTNGCSVKESSECPAKLQGVDSAVDVGYDEFVNSRHNVKYQKPLHVAFYIKNKETGDVSF